MKLLICGGLYGSEGKGCVADYFARQTQALVAFAESGPNSGHTNSAWCTHCLPSCAMRANATLIGPDAVIDLDQLARELAQLPKNARVYVHENAAITLPDDRVAEQELGLGRSISSTCTGSGYARYKKYTLRQPNAVAGYYPIPGVTVVKSAEWLDLVEELSSFDWIVEGSQGALLDTNFGVYPYVTSRSTLPLSIIGRNGLSCFNWTICSVYRTLPIRTGGPSGPCGGKELTWVELKLEPEIASTTKRVRRVFEWSESDFKLSLRLTRPDVVAITHLDYATDAFVADNIRSHFHGTVIGSRQPAKFTYL